MKTLHQGFWFLIGLVFLALGAVGAALPILPTVPFLLVSVFAFARSSKWFYSLLTEHPVVGPPIVDWQRSGAISRRVKWIATVSMLAGICLSFFAGFSWTIITVQALAITIAVAFIWTRPDR